jgi:hypothetical protein
MMVIAMSRTEIDRMNVSQDLAAGRIKATEAADASSPPITIDRAAALSRNCPPCRTG